MPTPTKAEIRRSAQAKYHQDNRHLPFITCTDSELKESGYWNESRNKLMRNSARSEHLAYIEQEATELGYALVSKKEFTSNENPKAKTETAQQIIFDVEEALRSGVFIAGGSGTGKTNIGKCIAKVLIDNNVIVFIADPTQAWYDFYPIENVITIQPTSTPQKINWNDEHTLFDTSRLSPMQQRKFIELFSAQLMYVATRRAPSQRPNIIVVFEEAHTPMYNGSMRATKSQQTATLLTQGRNFRIRFIAITQFPAMVDKLPVKLAQQRYFFRTSEKNDREYIEEFLEEHARQLKTLGIGECFYNYLGETQKIRVPRF